MSTVCFDVIAYDQKNNKIGPENMCYLMIYSFFLGELEKCLEDPDRLAPLFIKQVRNLKSFILLHLLCFSCRPSYLKFFLAERIISFLELSFAIYFLVLACF